MGSVSLTSLADEATRYVAAERLSLRSSPAPDGSVPQAELLQGAVVHVTEEREGWSRVTVWGWVRSDQLIDKRPELPIGEKPGPAEPSPQAVAARKVTVIPDVDSKGQRVIDLRRAMRLSVSTVPDPGQKDEGPAIAVAIGFLDQRGVLVSFENSRVDAELTLYEKRLVAGALTHGDKLYSANVVLSNWQEGFMSSGKIRIPLKTIDLKSARSDVGILVARAELPNGYVVYGRDYDVVLRRAEPKGEEKPQEKPAEQPPKPESNQPQGTPEKKPEKTPEKKEGG